MQLGKGLIAFIALLLAVVIVGLGGCAYSLTIDSRERKQQKIQQCVERGYGGMIELNDGRSFICTGGGIVEER